jgi:peptidoglycan/xylan/chitin deacetylase (PgdA/CDA1 family)
MTKPPFLLKALLPSKLIWSMPLEKEPAVYLTFDDGPHPAITPFVLQQFESYSGKATFFCIGKNVSAHPQIYQQVIDNGHTIGNHTQDHPNGWKTQDGAYVENVKNASKIIESRNFRPPYGRIKRAQAKVLWQEDTPWRIYMWDVLSADYDSNLTPEKCLQNVLEHIEPGSIVVFHDSDKAWPRMSYVLPRLLEHCRQKNWKVAALPKY